MKRAKHNQFLAELLAEVKLAEKKIQKLEGKIAPAAARIKAALRAGNREKALQFAETYEDLKQELTLAQKYLEAAKARHAQGKRQVSDAKSLKSVVAITKAQEGLVKAMDTLGGAEDMLSKIEEEAAVSEAKLDIAIDDAEAKNPGVDFSKPVSNAQAQSPISGAEDILAEFENDLGV
ncbi:hypothetical protein OAX78_03970 [Planctomycetota bacterium]|nr:hypothetical protein [Planctomycetota bacterium]